MPSLIPEFSSDQGLSWSKDIHVCVENIDTLNVEFAPMESQVDEAGIQILN